MMPKQNNITLLYLLSSIYCQFHYIWKVAIEDYIKLFEDTYLLPTGRLFGFISTYLNLAKKSSHGATSYE